LLLVLGTSSSESALPSLMLKLERLGCSRGVVGLVIPTGYSFNLDGTSIYLTMAAVFIAQATNTPLSFGDLVLTHYHAVRVLGASAFGARRIVATRMTADLIAERGEQDWASEQGRMPRLFEGAESIPGLTRPTQTFEERMTIDLGNRVVELQFLGRGHTSGDLVVWLPEERICFGGDLVEAMAAPYMGDAHIGDWRGETLDRVAAFGAEQMVGGRGPVVRGAAVGRAIADTRAFLSAVLDGTREVKDAGGTPREAYRSTHAALAPRYGSFPIFEHTMPFNVQRAWDELDGIDHPRIWTVERDRATWDALTA
jgi:glyoxylase-like metal-dependent hydrolase (beta-lactamase superfamily II)